MSRDDLRQLLHLLAGLCWAVALATDLEEHRWKAAGIAIASHFAAEIVGGLSGEQFA